MYSYDYANATSGWIKKRVISRLLRKEGYAQWSQFTWGMV